MELKNIILKFEQDGFAQQVLQKLVQIDGDVKMNRNHADNVKMLVEWVVLLNEKAADAGIPAYHRQMQNGHSSMRSLEEYLKNKIGFQSVEIRENFPTL